MHTFNKSQFSDHTGMQPERRAGGRGWRAVETCPSALSEIMKSEGGGDEQSTKRNRQSVGGHQTPPANRKRRTVPGSDCRQRSPNHPITSEWWPLFGGRFASDSATRCNVRLSGRCCGGALVTKLTACSKRSHASSSNAGSSAGLLPVAFVFFIGHLSLRLQYEVP